MHTDHLFLLLLPSPHPQKKKLLLLYWATNTKCLELHSKCHAFGLKCLFFRLMASDGFFFHLTREWWNSPVCQKSVRGSWPAQIPRQIVSPSGELWRTEISQRGKICCLTAFQVRIASWLKGFSDHGCISHILTEKYCVLMFDLKY